MKKNNEAFSLVIAMWLVLITSLLAFTILEFIVPFSRDIKWIENSTKSYYQANNWIERGLYFFQKRTDSQSRTELTRWYTANLDYTLSTTSSWTQIPALWKWNSTFSKDWDSLSVADPIQLIIWYWFITNLATLNIDFRVPDLNNDLIFWETLDWTTSPMVNWQLSSETDVLNSISTSVFTADNINWWNIQFAALNGKKVSDSSTVTFSTFFSTNNCNSNKCVLKISVIDDLKSSSKIIPFLEWKITAWANSVPLRYSTVESVWKSNGFSKNLQIRVPQETVSEAFDFTVFQ